VKKLPYLDKRVISAFFRTQCKRQLKLNLSPENSRYIHERQQEGMPPKQPPRPGLQQMIQVGRDWEIEKYSDIEDTFGPQAIIATSSVNANNKTIYSPTPLRLILPTATSNKFIFESEFDIRHGSNFESVMAIDNYRQNYNLDYADLRPDIIQILDPGTYNAAITPNGQEVPLLPNDNRLQIRVIDIKHTAEPSTSYFAEITFYMMALAGWLVDEGLDNRFVVVAGAVWPGSHDASALREAHREAVSRGVTLTIQQLNEALNKDLEENPFGVFASRLRRFFHVELVEVLQERWDNLEFHVSSRCSGCSYLGYPWMSGGQYTHHENHCMPIAERNNDLCRIPQLSKGAIAALKEKSITNVNLLAQLQSANIVLDSHQTLKAKRIVIPSRAQSLINNTPLLPQGVGSSSIMPKWSDLSIYVSVDFDITSGISVAFGLKAFWIEPVPYGVQNPNRRTRVWPGRGQGQAYTFPVDRRDLHVERRVLLDFLVTLQTVMQDALNEDQNTTFQVYIWDEIQLGHFQRIVGRHLPAILSNPSIADLAWLFPPEDILPNHQLQRKSPITVVKEVVSSLTALPIPHHYSLLETARVYHYQDATADMFNVHPLYEDFLSDQIPSERAHEIWSRSSNWYQQLNIYMETVSKRLSALESVTRRLQSDLRNVLQETSPVINISPPTPQGRMSVDGELWYAFSKLNAKISENEVLAIRALSIDEREAKFHSAKLIRRLTGQDELNALQSFGLLRTPNRRVYELGPNSRAVKMKEGDFLFALAPNFDGLFLSRKYMTVTRNNTHLQSLANGNFNLLMEDVTGVTIQAIDRDNGIIVVDINLRNGINFIDQLENSNMFNFSTNVSIDPVSKDFFTKKLAECLKAIGNPPLASRNQSVIQALGLTGRRGARQTPNTPAAEFLWDAANMDSSPSQISLWLSTESQGQNFIKNIQNKLEQKGIGLTPTQWDAWYRSLTSRLQLIWGPPGTGKSRTLRAIVLGMLYAGFKLQRSFRILVSASTYTALDNVLIDVFNDLQKFPNLQVEVARIRSSINQLPQNQSNLFNDIDVEINSLNQSERLTDLYNRLNSNLGLTLVGGTPQQVYNLIKMSGQSRAELFDVVIIDEASQMDVANAILPLCSLAQGGTLILAGDPKQLPPIHKAEAPLGLENMVGNVYSFMKDFNQVTEVMLDRNYRSNKQIVELGYIAGYGRNLVSHSPDLKLSLISPLSTTKPANWPTSLFWTQHWNDIMDPDKPVVCFIYPDGKSSQWNDFEVETTAALIQTVINNVSDQLANEIDANGVMIPTSTNPYTADEFWKQGIGIVTPHRAQQSKLVTRLQQLFGGSVSNPSIIRDAVDTVERFQGQQRDIIIASFALGDPDLIRDEEEFLMSLNRFNVIASRARAKLVVLVSQEIIDHMGTDLDILRDSRLLKVFSDTYCSKMIPMQLGFLQNQTVSYVSGVLKYR